MKFHMSHYPDTAMDIHKGMKFSVPTDMPGQIVQLGSVNRNHIFCKSVGEHLEIENKYKELPVRHCGNRQTGGTVTVCMESSPMININ